MLQSIWTNHAVHSFSSLVDLMATLLPPIDKEVILNDATIGPFLCSSFAEGFKHDALGAVDDSLAFVKPWGFEIGEARCPVFLYHGSEDKMCPFDHGKWIAEMLPPDLVRKRLFEGQGHVSIFIGKEGEMLEEMLECL